MTTFEEIETILSKILNTNITESDRDKDLMEKGMDSMKSIQLIVELESAFSISFDDNDLIFDKFNTVSKISKMVAERKMKKES